MISIRANAVRMMFPVISIAPGCLGLPHGARPRDAYFLPCLPVDLKYLKNSEFGSSTSTSLRPRKLAL